MNKVILDASALLALINQEKGHAMVEKYISQALMSSVNASEAAFILVRNGLALEETKNIINSLTQEIVDFDQHQAYIAANLHAETHKLGLSFGDRACLSLAKIKKLSVLTADKLWLKLQLNIDIILIR